MPGPGLRIKVLHLFQQHCTLVVLNFSCGSLPLPSAFVYFYNCPFGDTTLTITTSYLFSASHLYWHTVLEQTITEPQDTAWTNNDDWLISRCISNRLIRPTSCLAPIWSIQKLSPTTGHFVAANRTKLS